MQVVLFKGRAQFGVLRMFIDEIADGFAARGWKVAVLDLSRWPGEQVFLEFLEGLGPIDLTFAINILGNFRTMNDRDISAVTGAPFVLQYVDCPLHKGHLERLDLTASSAALLFPDRSHLADIRKIYGENRFSYLGFGPHAGLGAPVSLPASAAEFAAARPIPVLFAGNAMGNTVQPWQGAPDRIKTIFSQAADLTLSSDTLHTRDALDAVMRGYGFDIDAEANLPTMRNLWRMSYCLEDWVRWQRRQRFLAAASRVGLPMIVYGNGYETRYDNIEYREAVEFGEILRLMQQSRLVMNATAVFAQGGHERPLSAMLAGAAAASDYSRYFAEEFVPGREIVLFRWSHLEEDLQRIRDLAQDPGALCEMARAGQEKAAAHHRWANRIDGFLTAAGMSVK